MADLKIRVYKGGAVEPDTTVTIPGSVLQLARRLIPKNTLQSLQQEGVDIDELIELTRKPDVQGTLVEVEEHNKNEKIVIAIEQ
jgi:hypothetical protein